MDCTYTDVSYAETGYFSTIVSAYISGDERLKPFYRFPVSTDGLAQAIAERKKFPVDRKLLVSVLREQYRSMPVNEAVEKSIDALLNERTFTICTAHQPAIFTGSLFFIYKIVHAIRLAAELSKQHPENQFVPVFYMGSEDADLDELGHVFLNGEKLSWETSQQGAIGRMSTKGLERIIDRLEGEVGVYPFGARLITMLRECYLESADVQTATLKIVHRLFGEYGLVVLIPDHPALKARVAAAFETELTEQRSSKIVRVTIDALQQNFKVQASPRDINLFYLRDNIRNRIEARNDRWWVLDTDISFSPEEILKELRDHPERFSPNVILRGILQETLLPDVAFIGGGGELAYWLELKTLFERYGVFYPVLIVRNSFLVVDKLARQRIEKLRLSVTDTFRSASVLLNEIVARDSGRQLSLGKEIDEITAQYDQARSVAGAVDPTLKQHVEALHMRAVKGLEALQKKMLRAEKRKFSDDARHVTSIRKQLFPNDGLQERVENFIPFYARWGEEFLKTILKYSQTTEQRFRILNIDAD